MTSPARIICFLVLATLLSGCAIQRTYGPYRGKVIDAETEEPIEGAVLIMSFYTQTGNVGGSNAAYVDSKEVLTDQAGRFNLRHSMWTFRPLHFWDPMPIMRIFKPGYGVFPKHRDGTITPDLQGRQLPEDQHVVIRLPKLHTHEERLDSISDYWIGPSIPLEKKRKLRELENEERQSLGLKPLKIK